MAVDGVGGGLLKNCSTQERGKNVWNKNNEENSF